MRTGHPGTDPASIDVQTILLVTTAGLILQRVDHRDAVAVIPADGDGRPRVDAVEVTTTAGPLFPIDLTEQLVTPGYRPLVPDRLPAGTALVIDLGRHPQLAELVDRIPDLVHDRTSLSSARVPDLDHLAAVSASSTAPWRKPGASSPRARGRVRAHVRHRTHPPAAHRVLLRRRGTISASDLLGLDASGQWPPPTGALPSPPGTA